MKDPSDSGISGATWFNPEKSQNGSNGCWPTSPVFATSPYFLKTAMPNIPDPCLSQGLLQIPELVAAGVWVCSWSSRYGPSMARWVPPIHSAPLKTCPANHWCETKMVKNEGWCSWSISSFSNS